MCATLIPLEVYAHRCPRVSPQQRITFAGLSTEISSLPDMFGSINENFVTATVEGALVMVGDSIDLDALQSAADESGADILPAERNVGMGCVGGVEKMVVLLRLRLCVGCYSCYTRKGAHLYVICLVLIY
jgi:hypothetical protein